MAPHKVNVNRQNRQRPHGCLADVTSAYARMASTLGGERLLVQQAFSVHRAGKMLVPVIDDAHLMPTDCLRKLRLLREDFPRSHNLVLIGQPPLMHSLALSSPPKAATGAGPSATRPNLPASPHRYDPSAAIGA